MKDYEAGKRKTLRMAVEAMKRAFVGEGMDFPIFMGKIDEQLPLDGRQGMVGP